MQLASIPEIPISEEECAKLSKLCFAHHLPETQDAQQSFLQGLWGPQGQVSVSLSILSNKEVPNGEAHFH